MLLKDIKARNATPYYSPFVREVIVSRWRWSSVNCFMVVWYASHVNNEIKKADLLAHFV